MSLGWVLFLLLFDDVFPGEVSGEDREGNQIKLKVCPPQEPFDKIYRNDVNAVCWKFYWFAFHNLLYHSLYSQSWTPVSLISLQKAWIGYSCYLSGL